MNLRISGKHMEIGDAFRSRIEAKSSHEPEAKVMCGPGVEWDSGHRLPAKCTEA